MCGIIGFIGNGDGISSVLDGLTKLEYRGSDSAGLAYIQNNKVKNIKSVGSVDKLIEKVKNFDFPKDLRLAIGHSRWSTHGASTELNAHPHLSNNGEIAVVHNGIIENYLEITEFLKEHGIKIYSETDTEVIPNLIQYYYKGSLQKAVQKAVKHLKGSYAFVVLSAKDPGTLVCAKYAMPLCIGEGKGFFYITSDIPTALTRTTNIFVLDNGETAVISADKIEFWCDGLPVQKHAVKYSKSSTLMTKGEFTTFMEKEINDIPLAFQKLISLYDGTDRSPITPKLLSCLKNAETIHICACGTAYHAGLTLGGLIEKHCKIRVKNYIASEFRYSDPLIQKNDAGIVISQSGETADTIGAMNLLKANNIPVIAICNTDNSTIARDADYYLPTLAGFEIAVASTKAYCAQVLLGALLVNELFIHNSSLTLNADVTDVGAQQAGIALFSKKAFSLLPMHARSIIGKHKEFAALAAKYKDTARIFFLGKGLDAFTALEAALKVKEITYMQCEGYPAGELKHGTLSLVDNDTLTGIFHTCGSDIIKAKTANAAAEVKTRGSKIWNIDVPESPLAFCFSIIPVQLFALHLCQQKELNPDKPRNLTKAVSVE